MKKPTLCCCFTLTVFIELNFAVAFLLIRKTWDDRFAGKVGGYFKNFKNHFLKFLKSPNPPTPTLPAGGGDGDTPLQTGLSIYELLVDTRR